MPFTPSGVEYLVPDDDFDPTGIALADSLEGRVFAVAVNTTDRDAIAAAHFPSTRPLVVYRFDAPAGAKIETSQDGTTWWPVGRTAMPTTPSPPTALSGTYAGQPLRPGGGRIEVSVSSAHIGTVNLGTGYTGGLLGVTLTGTDDPPAIPRIVVPAPSHNSVQVVTRRLSDGLGTGAGTFRFTFTSLGWD